MVAYIAWTEDRIPSIILRHRTLALARVTTIAFYILLFSGIMVVPAMSQSLSTIKVGDSATQLETLGVPATSEQKMGPHTAIRFELPDGNSLSATYRNRDGLIVFLESDWGGSQSGSFTDFRNFKFGITSLNDIRQELGHNGMLFVKGPGMSSEAGDLIVFNSYEIDGSSVVVTVVNKIAAERLTELRKTYGDEKTASLIGKEARLDAIIVADMDYLVGIWGDELMKDKNYRTIRW